MTYVQRQAQAGFTLIEILIALAIVIIAGAIVVPYFTGQIESSRKKTAKATVRTMRGLVDQFEADHGKYPTSLKDLVKRPTDEEIARNWTQYMQGKDVPKDPWGKSYQYRVTPDEEHPYELYSYGSKQGKNTPRAEWISVWDL
jgi:general secretion pathway protein G